MNNDKVNELLKQYDARLYHEGVPVERHPPEQPLPPSMDEAREIAKRHIRYMCVEALTWSEERLEKKFRWLGFIQGAFWSFGLMPVEQLKKDNMPTGTEYKA